MIDNDEDKLMLAALLGAVTGACIILGVVILVGS